MIKKSIWPILIGLCVAFFAQAARIENLSGVPTSGDFLVFPARKEIILGKERVTSLELSILNRSGATQEYDLEINDIRGSQDGEQGFEIGNYSDFSHALKQYISLGEAGTGYSTSTNYLVQAGYQQARDEGFISISLSASSAGLSPAVITSQGGISGGQIGIGILTDSQAGYTLSIAASSYNPTLRCPACAAGAANHFKDYYPAISGTPDFSWVAPVATSSFGFTAEGPDISSYFKDNGAACGLGNNDSSDTCWYGFDYSAYLNRPIALVSLPNNPVVSTTTVKFKAESAASNAMAAGSYLANIIVTAAAN